MKSSRSILLGLMAGQRPCHSAGPASLFTVIVTPAAVECPRPGPVAREARGRPCAGRPTELARPHSRSEPCRTRLRMACRSLRPGNGRRGPRHRGRGRGRTRENSQTRGRQGGGRGGKRRSQGCGRTRICGRTPSRVGGQPGGRARGSRQELSRGRAGIGRRKMEAPGTATGRRRRSGQGTDIGRRSGMKPGHFARRAPIISRIRRPPARRRPRLHPPLENGPRKG